MLLRLFAVRLSWAQFVTEKKLQIYNFFILFQTATDQDVGKNAEIEYTIQSVNGGGMTTVEEDANTFKIDGRSGVISTRSSLDREASEVYTIIVTANDLTTPHTERKSATATVVVKVLDGKMDPIIIVDYIFVHVYRNEKFYFFFQITIIILSSVNERIPCK